MTSMPMYICEEKKYNIASSACCYLSTILIKTHLVPDSWLDRYTMELGIKLLELVIHSVALSTLSYVLFDIITHPQKMAANLVKCFVMTQMATCMYITSANINAANYYIAILYL